MLRWRLGGLGGEEGGGCRAVFSLENSLSG